MPNELLERLLARAFWNQPGVKEMTASEIAPRTCSRCKETKPSDAFGRLAGGLNSNCKACRKVITAAYRESVRNDPAAIDRKRARDRAWYATNSEKVRERSRAARQANPEREKAARDAQYEKHKERRREQRRERSREYRSRNLAAIRARQREARNSLADHIVVADLSINKPASFRRLIPQSLIEAKREHIKLQRLIKEMTT